MNLQWYNILAAGDDGLVGTLIFVGLLVVSLVGHIIKKAQEKQQVEEANRKVEQAKRRHAAGKHASGDTQQTKPPPAAPPRPPAPAVEARQQVPVVHAAEALGQGVSREVVQVEKQLATKERQQRQRLAPAKHLQPKIGPKAVLAEGASSDGPKVHLNLTSPKAAKTAIICAEILGLPKALRSDPEPWDM